MYCIKLPITPIANEHSVLVFGREIGAISKTDACWRSRPDIYYWRYTIRKINRPLSGSITPSKLRATYDMADSRWSIPRCINIPFHICVISKQFSFSIKGRVELVAKARRNKLPIPSIRPDLCDPTSRRWDASHKPASVRSFME